MKYWFALSLAVCSWFAINYYLFESIREKQTSEYKYIFNGTPEIVDGDTIILNETRLRFRKFDTCEISQPALTTDGYIDCGKWATDRLRELVSTNEMTCFGDRKDRYERPIVECKTKTIPDLGIAMLERGYAFLYSRRKFLDAKIVAYHARQKKLGVWGFVAVDKPRIWRNWRKRNRRK